MLEHPLLRRVMLMAAGFVSPVPLEVWAIMYYVLKWKTASA